MNAVREQLLAGGDDVHPRKRYDSDTPRGVSRCERIGSYRIAYTDGEGCKRQKYVKGLDDDALENARLLRDELHGASMGRMVLEISYFLSSSNF